MDHGLFIFEGSGSLQDLGVGCCTTSISLTSNFSVTTLSSSFSRIEVKLATLHWKLVFSVPFFGSPTKRFLHWRALRYPSSVTAALWKHSMQQSLPGGRRALQQQLDSLDKRKSGARDSFTMINRNQTIDGKMGPTKRHVINRKAK